MTDDEFDTLVDDATHAVNNLIPNRLLAVLSKDVHSDLLVRINDALTPILRELAESEAAPDGSNGMQPSIVAAFLAELIETHMGKCDEASDHPEDRPAHIISDTFDAKGNIASIAFASTDAEARLYLVLDSGTAFRITVESVEGL